MPKLNVLISGSTGYIGIQLIKLLVKHRYVKIKYLCGNSSVGKKISYFDKSLINKKLNGKLTTDLKNAEVQYKNILKEYLNCHLLTHQQ